MRGVHERESGVLLAQPLDRGDPARGGVDCGGGVTVGDGLGVDRRAGFGVAPGPDGRRRSACGDGAPARLSVVDD
ncbi:hypothetical protein [Rhodococcoides kroppenstedtii]|uniref:hypothetical protein n=1 Tax=Rhodococcoides kroppenstedtii TaxID=293050 RepID=UPI001BDEDF74|nr:hypothetical protein [Rhodococcus kroppenstedtii]MBT1191592.1 hypothetical protein [Rhodococcus kroppenstedtii]